MIKTFEEFINEGFWKDGIKRAKNNDVRRENGVKVKTSLGVDIVLQNPDYDYESLIKDILSGGDGGHPLDLDIDFFRNYTAANRTKVLEGENEYVFLISSNNMREKIALAFGDFDEMKETSTIFDNDDISKEDYLAICKGIADALSQKDMEWGRPDGSTSSSMFFLLMSENEVYHMICDLEEYGREFDLYELTSEFKEAFPDCNLVAWSWNNNACALGLVIDYDNLIHYFDCMEFVSSYFENEIEYAKEMKEDEDLNEGFWKDGINRAKNNIDRLEVSKFFKRPEIHQIKDYPEYYCEEVGESKRHWDASSALLIYHYPNEDPVAEYTNYDPNFEEDKEFSPYAEYWEYYHLDGNGEENKLIHSDEFQKALWETMVEIYEEYNE